MACVRAEPRAQSEAAPRDHLPPPPPLRAQMVRDWRRRLHAWDAPGAPGAPGVEAAAEEAPPADAAAQD